ncbi:MAG: HPr family phosphocarrier protein [Alphaproteobacteria bacterium]|nr:HPr family phosphocarrier protein [Alphaproteobacteria bacterium]
MTANIVAEIMNKKGLHARAAAKFVKTVAAFDAQVKVQKIGDDSVVGGGSILGLMMLGADIGSTLSITAEGAQEAEVIAALAELIAGRFGEPE